MNSNSAMPLTPPPAIPASICGLATRLTPRRELLCARLAAYRAEGAAEAAAPQIVVDVDETRIERMRAKYENRLTEGECEYLLAGQDFYRQLLRFDGCMLHASAVVLDGRAVLFSAPCGTGKSTHAARWLSAFGARAYVLNDDKPGLRLLDGQLFAYGTPFSGKCDLSRNARAPVAAICFLERAQKNWIEPSPRMWSLRQFLNQTVRHLPPEEMDLLLRILDGALRATPVFRLGVNQSEDAARMAARAIFETDDPQTMSNENEPRKNEEETR